MPEVVLYFCNIWKYFPKLNPSIDCLETHTYIYIYNIAMVLSLILDQWIQVICSNVIGFKNVILDHLCKNISLITWENIAQWIFSTSPPNFSTFLLKNNPFSLGLHVQVFCIFGCIFFLRSASALSFSSECVSTKWKTLLELSVSVSPLYAKKPRTTTAQCTHKLWEWTREMYASPLSSYWLQEEGRKPIKMATAETCSYAPIVATFPFVNYGNAVHK